MLTGRAPRATTMRALVLASELFYSSASMTKGNAIDAVGTELVAEVDREVREFLSKKAPQHRETLQQLKPGEQLWGKVDSLLLLALVGHLEKTFKFKVAPKDFTPENFSSIERIAAFVERSRSA